MSKSLGKRPLRKLRGRAVAQMSKSLGKRPLRKLRGRAVAHQTRNLESGTVNEIVRRDGGQLDGRTVAILMETDYVEPEIDYYQRRFAEEGATVVFLTRLWGQQQLTFTGHEYRLPFTVDGDLEAVDDDRLRDFDALIVPSGMVSDRLRYAEHPNATAPAVDLLRRAFAEPTVLKGIICHGMWLVAPIPEVIAGRSVTCHNNLISDVRNMGGTYTDQDVVVAGDLVTGRSAEHCHLFARTMIDLLAARGARGSKKWWRQTVPSGAGRVR
jgi:protease I